MKNDDTKPRVTNMVPKILNDFHDARIKEHEKSGKDPTVCIVGKLSYDEFLVALCVSGQEMRYQSNNAGRLLQYEGIEVYHAWSFDHGFIFGGL